MVDTVPTGLVGSTERVAKARRAHGEGGGGGEGGSRGEGGDRGSRGGGGEGGSRVQRGRASYRGAHRLSAVVLVLGLAVTGALTVSSRLLYLHGERRLTELQTKLTATSLSVATVDVERRLGAGLGPVAADGNVATFKSAMGASLKVPFASVLLFRMSHGQPKLAASIGARPLLPPGSSRAISICRQTAATKELVVNRLLTSRAQRFAYSMSARGPAGTFVAYAEEVLPADRRVVLPSSSPDYDLRFAVYYGAVGSPNALVETTARLPFGGPVVTVPIPFGDRVLTLVAAPRVSIEGTFTEDLAWAVLVGGLVLSCAAAVLTERLLRQRGAAELLAAQNRRLYQSQRSVSERLQQSLLPEHLPTSPHFELAVRYLPGTAGIEVGGDWYDVVELGADHVFFTVGDVAGRGLDAAILMGSLRNAITAYAKDGDAPEEVLAKVGRLVDVASDGRFATVLCGLLDISTGRVRLANAGHLPPIWIEGHTCRVVETALGPPVGLAPRYASVDLSLSLGSTLLAFTDGLVERRGEPLSKGIDRLCRAAGEVGNLEQLLDSLVTTLVPSGPSDDIAILGVRWRG